MKRNDKKSPATREICGVQESRAKMKVDGAIAATNVRQNFEAPVSVLENEYAHPRDVDDGTRAPAHQPMKEVAVMNEDNNGYGLDGAPLLTKALGMAFENAPKKTLKVDVEKYQAWLDDPDLSAHQKEQIVEALWRIIVCFVDLGYGVAPLQEACGKLEEIEDECGAATAGLLTSKRATLSDEFNQSAVE